jgi:hypothetical protein
MSATNAFETSLLTLYFNGTAIANIADNAASSPATAFYISLHTADPGETGNQASSETSYTGYARVSVNRNSGGFTVSGNSATNTATITFGQCTGGAQTLTHFGIGRSSSGTGTLDFVGALNSSLVLASGATPLFSASQLTVTCD